MHVYSWVPGETISPGADDGESNHHESNHHDGPKLEPFLYFVMIGVPIIGILLIGFCIRCCVVYHRVKKVERRERWLAEHELTTNVVDSQGK